MIILFLYNILIFIFSDRTKSASHFGNDLFNFTQEKSDSQKQNVNKNTRIFG